MRSIGGRLKVWGAALAVGLCGVAPVTAVRAQDPQKLPPKTTVDTMSSVTVQNNRKTSVAVYLEYGRFDRRLGIVEPLGMQVLRLPDYALKGRQSVRLFAHPNGELGDLATQEIWLKAPARLSLVIPAIGAPLSNQEETMEEVIPPDQLDEATITVENPRSVPCTILAVQGTFDVRLGIVPAHGRETLRFPTSVLRGRALAIVIHPEGGLDLQTQRMTVNKGDHLGIKVPEH